MAESKKSLVDEFIRARVREALAKMALDTPSNAEWLKAQSGYLASSIASLVCYDKYRFLELQDIMAWRKRKVDD